MRQFGLKHEARALASAANVPLTPGSGLLDSVAHALEEAKRVGFLDVKKHGRWWWHRYDRCDSADELAEAFATVKRLGEQFFNDAGLFIERFVEEARHVEVQIVGDGLGTVAALGERDCSLQRRNQKVVEETLALRTASTATRERMLAAAVSLGESVNYQSVGTVEFIYDGKRDDFYFLEVNTRLQVEHPITEAVTGIDLVEWMLLIAAGFTPNSMNYLRHKGQPWRCGSTPKIPCVTSNPHLGL